jgi:hypothetical protein
MTRMWLCYMVLNLVTYNPSIRKVPGLKKWARDWNPYNDMYIAPRDPVHANPESRNWEIDPGLQSLIVCDRLSHPGNLA